MKKIILLALVAVMMVGCLETSSETEGEKCLKGFNIVVIDSCEYLIKDETYSYQGYGYCAHKGNCRFCVERRKAELRNLLENLKTNNYD